MISNVFNHGTGKAKSATNYLLGDKNHDGKTRTFKPEIISGDPSITEKICDQITRKAKYISGVITFKPGENPTDQQQLETINAFRKSMFPGLKHGENFNDLWIRHIENGITEMHFVIPATELITGKQLNIHPPGKNNLEHWRNFDKVMNDKFSFAQVVPDPLKIALSGFDRKSPLSKKENHIKETLSKIIKKGIINGKIENRADLIKFLETKIEITRVGQDYLSVMLPGSKKATRLKGELFKEDGDYKKLLAEHKESKKPKFLTHAESIDVKDKMLSSIKARENFNNKCFKSKPTGLRRIAASRIKNGNQVKPRSAKSGVPKSVKLPQTKPSNPANLDVSPNEFSLDKAITEKKLGAMRDKNWSKDNAPTSGSSNRNTGSIAIIGSIGNLNAQLNDLKFQIQNEKDAGKRLMLQAKALEIEAKLESLFKQEQEMRLKESNSFARSKFKK